MGSANTKTTEAILTEKEDSAAGDAAVTDSVVAAAAPVAQQADQSTEAGEQAAPAEVPVLEEPSPAPSTAATATEEAVSAGSEAEAEAEAEADDELASVEADAEAEAAFVMEVTSEEASADLKSGKLLLDVATAVFDHSIFGCGALGYPGAEPAEEVTAALSALAAKEQARQKSLEEARAAALERAKTLTNHCFKPGTGYGYNEDGDWDDFGDGTVDTVSVVSQAHVAKQLALLRSTGSCVKRVGMLLEQGEEAQAEVLKVVSAPLSLLVAHYMGATETEMLLNEESMKFYTQLYKVLAVAASAAPASAAALFTTSVQLALTSQATAFAATAEDDSLEEGEKAVFTALAACHEAVKGMSGVKAEAEEVAISETSTVAASDGSEDESKEVNLAAAYEKEMAGFRLNLKAVNLQEGHHYKSTLEADKGKVAKGMIKRVKRELRAMKTALPVQIGSSIFLRADKARPYCMQALIFAPEGTPYDSGAFVFDIYCPPSYPGCSPKVNLMTTGHGKVRFNPNLYNCGKVCLSILGTWSGSVGENWGPDSTLLQVLVSIQALIFVEFPYFNEPSYEQSQFTERGDREARYSTHCGWERLRVATLQYAMVESLQHPPAGFEEAVKTHFRLKANHIKRTMAAWLEDAKSSTDEEHPKLLKEQVQAMLAELEKLEPYPGVPVWEMPELPSFEKEVVEEAPKADAAAVEAAKAATESEVTAPVAVEAVAVAGAGSGVGAGALVVESDSDSEGQWQGVGFQPMSPLSMLVSDSESEEDSCSDAPVSSVDSTMGISMAEAMYDEIVYPEDEEEAAAAAAAKAATEAATAEATAAMAAAVKLGMDITVMEAAAMTPPAPPALERAVSA